MSFADRYHARYGGNARYDKSLVESDAERKHREHHQKIKDATNGVLAAVRDWVKLQGGLSMVDEKLKEAYKIYLEALEG